MVTSVSEPSSSSEPYVLSSGEILFYWGSSATSFVIAIGAAAQLIRIQWRSHQLSRQPRKRHFLAKRIFHILLLASMLLKARRFSSLLFTPSDLLALVQKIADGLFVLLGPCWTRPELWEHWSCWPIDSTLRRTFAVLLCACYIVVLIFWSEFVYSIKNGSSSTEFFERYLGKMVAVGVALFALLVAYSMSLFLLHRHSRAQHTIDLASQFFVGIAYVTAGVGIVWKGTAVTLYVRQTHKGETNRLVVKIFVVVLICSALLLFRAVWAMFWGAIASYKGVVWPMWLMFFFHILCEIIPALGMMFLMFPLPPSPGRGNLQYERVSGTGYQRYSDDGLSSPSPVSGRGFQS